MKKNPSVSSTQEQTPSKKSAKLMSFAALKEVEAKYQEVLKAKEVWQLKSGRIVEEVMLELALKVKYEQ